MDYVLNFFCNFCHKLFWFHITETLNRILFWGGKRLLKLKALNVDWEKGAVMLKDSKGSKAEVESKSSIMYNTKKAGVDLGFICRDNTLLSNDKTLRQI